MATGRRGTSRALGCGHRGKGLLDRRFTTPEEVRHALTSELKIMVVQTGEVGPIAQAIAGIDTAMWDLVARKEGLTLYRCLGSAPVESVPVYATSINPTSRNVSPSPATKAV